MNKNTKFDVDPNGPRRSFAFLGEAGSGKSEIAISFAKALVKPGGRPVHFFDLDMTKPLFRSRDAGAELERAGVMVHYQEQFMDAPTLVGGVAAALRDGKSLVVLDVGGGSAGARSIGGFASQLNSPACAVFYVINAYRPWSDTIEHIDGTLSRILGVSHVKLSQLSLVANPNNGADTTLDEVVEGCRRTDALVREYLPLSFACVREELAEAAAKALPVPVFPLRLALSCPWLSAGEI